MYMFYQYTVTAYVLVSTMEVVRYMCSASRTIHIYHCSRKPQHCTSTVVEKGCEWVYLPLHCRRTPFLLLSGFRWGAVSGRRRILVALCGPNVFACTRWECVGSYCKRCSVSSKLGSAVVVGTPSHRLIPAPIHRQVRTQYYYCWHDIICRYHQ